jgi:hypothetical protein
VEYQINQVFEIKETRKGKKKEREKQTQKVKKTGMKV